MAAMKEYVSRAKENYVLTTGSEEDFSFKVVVLFNSVSDSLLGVAEQPEDMAKMEHPHGQVTPEDLQKFQLSLTLEYEFDYLEVYTPLEMIEFLKEMHLSIIDKPYRKELSMYSRRGFRPGQKAQLHGFKGSLELTYIAWLMCIPGLSEAKAIALAKAFPTYN